MTCEICGKKQANNAQLRRHIRHVHEGKKNIKCDIPGCDKAFVDNKGLKYHKKAHDGVRLDCDFCDKDFANDLSLKAHVDRIHKGIKKYRPCPHCGKEVEFLTSHIINTHSEKKFSCNQCGQKYPTEYKLQQHVEVVHEGIRKYSCDECGKTFPKKFNLTSHKKTVHEGIKAIVMCEDCGKTLSSTSALNLHIQMKHQEAKHLHLCYNITCNELPQYLWQGIHPNRMLQEILL